MTHSTSLQESVAFRRTDALAGVEIMDVEWSARDWRWFNTAFSAVLIRNWHGEAQYRGRRHAVKPGVGFYTEPGETHSTPRVDHAGCFNVFAFEPETFHEYLRDQGIAVTCAHLTKAVSVMSPALTSSLLALSCAFDTARSPLHAQSCFADVVAAMASELVEQGRSNVTPLDAGAQAAERIRDCLHEDRNGIDLTTLARETGLSRFQVLRTFKRRYGLPPHAYQLAVRLARARQLLADGMAPAKVATECGFVDQSHLTRHFRQFLGVTPMAYAKAGGERKGAERSAAQSSAGAGSGGCPIVSRGGNPSPCVEIACSVAIDNGAQRYHAVGMAFSERVQRALVVAASLSLGEREELITELILGLERDRDPEPGYDEAWSAELRRRVDAVVGGKSKGVPWPQVRREIEARLAERRRESA